MICPQCKKNELRHFNTRGKCGECLVPDYDPVKREFSKPLRERQTEAKRQAEKRAKAKAAERELVKILGYPHSWEWRGRVRHG